MDILKDFLGIIIMVFVWFAAVFGPLIVAANWFDRNGWAGGFGILWMAGAVLGTAYVLYNARQGDYD